MIRHAIFSVFIFASVASLSCQPYTAGLKQSVVRADEVSAIAALHSIAVAQRSYAATSGGDYGTFQQLAQGDYLDSRFNSDKPRVKDYSFTMDVGKKPEGGARTFSCNADPISADKPGRHFYMDSDSPETHVNPDQPATASDPVFQP
jgi:hypothetical protein